MRGLKRLVHWFIHPFVSHNFYRTQVNLGSHVWVLSSLKEASPKKISVHLGIARLGEGGLNPCQDDLSNLFSGELSKYKQAFA